MNQDNTPINPLPDVLPAVNLPCTCECGNSLGGAKLDSTREYYATPKGTYSINSVPWNLVRAALAKNVAPASLAAEQKFYGTQPSVLPKTLPAGTRWWARGARGSPAAVREFLEESQLSGERYRGKTSASDGSNAVPPSLIDWSTVPIQEEPPSAKRPECDACGRPSCASQFGTECATYPGHPEFQDKYRLCADCWQQTGHTNRAAIARRKKLASGSAGSVQREQCESGSPALNRTEKPATEPVAPGRPSRDPYAGCSDFLREGIVGAAMREHDAERLAAMTPKQRQAAEMLLRPARPKVYRAHPASWPEQSYDDVDELGSA